MIVVAVIFMKYWKCICTNVNNCNMLVWQYSLSVHISVELSYIIFALLMIATVLTTFDMSVDSGIIIVSVSHS